jgi:hypothetical protein
MINQLVEVDIKIREVKNGIPEPKIAQLALMIFLIGFFACCIIFKAS